MTVNSPEVKTRAAAAGAVDVVVAAMGKAGPNMRQLRAATREFWCFCGNRPFLLGLWRLLACSRVFLGILRGRITGRMPGNSELELKEIPREYMVRP